MRILIACIVIICLGGILTAAYTLQPAQLSSTQLQQVTANCAGCHPVPPFQGDDQVHSSHGFLECSACHGTSVTGRGGIAQSRVNTSLCARCHSVPQYTDAVALHDAHSGAECAVCHTENSRLTAAVNIHNRIRQIGIGLVILGIVGIVLNYSIVSSRLRKRG